MSSKEVGACCGSEVTISIYIQHLVVHCDQGLRDLLLGRGPCEQT